MSNKISSIAIAIIFLLSGSLFAQNTESATHLDSLTKRLIINVLEVNGQPDAKKLFVNTTDLSSNFKLMQSFFSSRTNKDVSNVANYTEFLSSLKDLNNGKVLLVDSIKDFLSTNKIFKKVSEEEKKKFLEALSHKYKKEQSTNVATPISNTDSVAVEQILFKSKTTFTLWNLIWFAGGAIFIGIIWLLIAKSKIKNMKLDNRNTVDNSSLNNQLKVKINRLETEVNKLNDQIIELKSRLQKAEIWTNKLTEELAEAKQSDNSKADSLVESAVLRANYKYFSTPLNDGSFKETDGRDVFLEGATIYRFAIKSDTEADFEFCVDPSSIGIALNNRTDLILTVAEEKEGNAFNAKGISTYEGNVGKAKLENGKWIVEHKLQIKYI